MAKRVKKIRKNNYRKQRKVTSIYFLLWAAFSVLSLVIVLMIGFTQNIIMRDTFKTEAAKELSVSGPAIGRKVLGDVPAQFEGNRGVYIEFISAQEIL